MKTIAMIIMVAIVLEALVEYVKTIIHMLEEAEYKTAITQGVTIVLGIFLSFAFHTELFNGALSEIYEGLKINPALDMILTGILFSRGSNYFSDFISRLTKKPLSDDFYDEEFIELDEEEEEGDEDGITEEGNED